MSQFHSQSFHRTGPIRRQGTAQPITALRNMGNDVSVFPPRLQPLPVTELQKYEIVWLMKLLSEITSVREMRIYSHLTVQLE